MKRMIGLAVVLAALAVPHHAAALNARQMLQKLRLVDGAGSGLDADTVQGMTPAMIATLATAGATTGATAAATAAVNTALGLLLNSAYSNINSVTVADGFCNTVDVVCTAGDFLLNCSGAVTLTSGYLTQAGELATERVCRAGGCGFGGTAGVTVVATCLRR